MQRAHVTGYSHRGAVALQLALRHPELVGTLMSLSATYRQDGRHPSVLEAIGDLEATALAGTPIEKAFYQHTPEPAAFTRHVEKMTVLTVADQQISDAQMRSITAKAMVIVGDADGVKPEHALAMFRLLGGGDEDAAATGVLPTVPRARLVVLPATSHLGILGETEALVPTVTAFPDDVPPVTPELFRADVDRQAAT